MRMWMVDPAKLCDIHLKREHRELHQFADMLRGEWDISDDAMIEKALSHSLYGQVFPDMMQIRHRQLADEFERRGLDHYSELEAPMVRFKLPSVSLQRSLLDHNLERLSMKCDKCEARIKQ